MTLALGARLGSYEVVGALGAGGMGEVYRARDTKLGRNVAIKLLPDTFAHDPDRVARFKREAQILATLNHAHIAGIHGLEEANGSAFLVLEFVDGETLAEKLAAARPEGRSPKPEAGALSVAEALAIARQIVDALEAAHEKGIIHRDLKPANIMLTADGQVKVLDFGLAKQEPGPGAAAAPGGLTHSPTLSFAATQVGMILGTAAYMSPEQAKGRPADKRSDVWAFGCVLYEMLAGKRAFDGEDVTDIIAAVVRTDPDWTALPAVVPPQVRTILKRCLVKDRKTRIPDMSVVRFMLDEFAGFPEQGLPSTPPGAAEFPEAALLASRQERRRLLLWKTTAAVLTITIVAGGAVTYLTRSAMPAAARFVVEAPEKTTFVANGRPGAIASISPDGRRLAFTARDSAGRTQLWVRAIDSLVAQPLAGTEGAGFPFWSPDSRQIAYSTVGKLMKVDASGGPPQVLCEFSGRTIMGRGGSWNRDGLIVFSNGPGPLHGVSSAGGTPSPLLQLGAGQSAHVFPSFLPDGHHVLFYADATSTEVSGIYVASLDTGESTRLLGADTGGIYALDSGQILFVRRGTLLAQPFDRRGFTLSGEPVPVAEGVESAAVPGVMAFAVSENGVLSYGVGSADGVGLQLTWVDRQGKTIETVGPEANYRGLDLAPDGKRVAAHRHDGPGGDIWISEPSPGPTSRFTFDPSQDNMAPLWSRDGSFIAYASLRSGKWGIYRKPPNQAGPEEQLAESDSPVIPTSWSPDGQSIVYERTDPKTRADLWLLPLSRDRKPTPLLQSPIVETFGQISPDGKWLAYQEGSGVTEINSNVYVQPFPAGAGKWQISTNGGTSPKWRGDGRELFFVSVPSGGKMMAADIRPGASTIEPGTPKELFGAGYISLTHSAGGTFRYQPYAVSADGQRFLIPRLPATYANDAASAPIVVVLNWEAALRN